MRWMIGAILSFCLVGAAVGKEASPTPGQKPPSIVLTPAPSPAATRADPTDQQCSIEYLKSMPAGKQREELASRCARRGDFKSSPIRSW